jgi:hypothetical protein
MIMTQQNESFDFQHDSNHHFPSLNWRLEPLETSQMSWDESFNLIYARINNLKTIINQRFDDFEVDTAEMNTKIDVILQHIGSL